MVRCRPASNCNNMERLRGVRQRISHDSPGSYVLYCLRSPGASIRLMTTLIASLTRWKTSHTRSVAPAASSTACCPSLLLVPVCLTDVRVVSAAPSNSRSDASRTSGCSGSSICKKKNMRPLVCHATIVTQIQTQSVGILASQPAVQCLVQAVSRATATTRCRMLSCDSPLSSCAVVC